jgi:uncharacterized protein YdhG (YjbR/CyaY superfamily)
MSPTAKKPEQQPGKSTKKEQGFSAEEKAAMRARARELKSTEDGETAVRAALEEMPPDDRELGERLHALVREIAPELVPRTWYGMPAYTKDGKVVCYFQSAAKFKARYATFGFNDAARVDQGTMWPVSFALKELSEADEKKLRALVRKAVK